MRGVQGAGRRRRRRRCKGYITKVAARLKCTTTVELDQLVQSQVEWNVENQLRVCLIDSE